MNAKKIIHAQASSIQERCRELITQGTEPNVASLFPTIRKEFFEKFDDDLDEYSLNNIGIIEKDLKETIYGALKK